jgi:hypothetical protein
LAVLEIQFAALLMRAAANVLQHVFAQVKRPFARAPIQVGKLAAVDTPYAIDVHPEQSGDVKNRQDGREYGGGTQ